MNTMNTTTEAFPSAMGGQEAANGGYTNNAPTIQKDASSTRPKRLAQNKATMKNINRQQKQSPPALTAEELEKRQQEDETVVSGKVAKGLTRADALAIMQRQREYDCLPHAKKRRSKVAEFLEAKAACRQPIIEKADSRGGKVQSLPGESAAAADPGDCAAAGIAEIQGNATPQ